MKYSLLIIVLTLSLSTKALNLIDTSGDYKNLSFAVYIPDQVEFVAPEAKSFLENKIQIAVNENGISGRKNKERFIVTAKISVVNTDVTATAPANIILNLMVVLVAGDAIEGKKYSSMALNIRGVGQNETSAYINAIKNISPSDQRIKTFFEQAKNRILEYYNGQCDFIIKKGELFANQGQYDQAIFTLSQVPEVSKNCYVKCISAIAPIYKKKIDSECLQYLNQAKLLWASSPTSSTASEVATILSKISPAASCINEVQKFANEVAKKVNEIDKRNWDFAVKAYQTEAEIRKETVKAIRDIGVAYASNQPDIIYDVTVIRTWY